MLCQCLAKYNFTPTTNMFIGAGQSIRVPDAKELYVVQLQMLHSVNNNSATNGGNQNLNETINREIDLGSRTYSQAIFTSKEQHFTVI